MFSLVKFGFILYGMGSGLIYQQFNLDSPKAWAIMVYPIFLVLVLYIPSIYNFFFKFNEEKLRQLYIRT